MWNSQRILGSLAVTLLLGTSSSLAGELTNVTLGRFQDFTVVTLFGNGPMSVTHQIVEAKDGKPHRIVVDVTGATHGLPQNNFMELPEGSITTLRTSQFAVSPEPVVRVVLDLAHPAAYRLETPENQVRVMVSLPGDPPMDKTWSARDGMPGGPFEAPAAYAEAPASQASEPEAGTDANTSVAATNDTQAAGEATAAAVEAGASTAPETGESPAVNADSVQPGQNDSTPEWNNPAKVQPESEIKALPLAPAGALVVTEEAGSEQAATAGAVESDVNSSLAASTESPAQTESATAVASAQVASQPSESTDAAHEASEATEATAEEATLEPSPTWTDEQATDTYASDEAPDAPQVPLPEGSIEQPERVIDYNLPIPAALAESSAPEGVAGPVDETSATTEPRLAVKADDESASQEAQPTGELATQASDAVNAPVATDAAVTDSGSAPVASLTTLPPLPETAAELVPERTQVIYHTQGRRDPFKPLLTSGGYNAAALPDVSSLRLVGVLHDVQESWGLFEDANGFGYILRKGDRVKNGSLAQLTNNRAYFNLTEFGWSRSVHLDLEPEG